MVLSRCPNGDYVYGDYPCPLLVPCHKSRQESAVWLLLGGTLTFLKKIDIMGGRPEVSGIHLHGYRITQLSVSLERQNHLPTVTINGCITA